MMTGAKDNGLCPDPGPRTHLHRRQRTFGRADLGYSSASKGILGFLGGLGLFGRRWPYLRWPACN
eukprot:9502528-Lingulodinium_polyedra.AAC.1